MSCYTLPVLSQVRGVGYVVWVGDIDAALAALKALLGTGDPVAARVPNLPTEPPPWPPWSGAASDAAKLRSSDLDGQRRRLYQQQVEAYPIISGAGQTLIHARKQMDAVIAAWQADKFSIGWLANTVQGQQALIAAGQQRLAEAAGVIREAMHEFARAAEQLNAISDDFPLTPGQERSAQLQMPQLPPEDASAQDVENWWHSLSQDDKDRLIAAHPQRLGNLNGIPAAVRDPVNRAVLSDDLHRVEDIAKLGGVDVSEILNDPSKYGLTSDDITRYTNAVQTRHGLDHDRTWTADGKNTADRPVMLWAYDPLAFQGRGKAAIAIGNPDWARNTAVIVPGTGSSVKSGWLAGGRNDAAVLYDQSALADPDSTSVIAWMGYETPDSFTDPDIGNTTLARQGGNLLAADVNGLGVTHNGPANITVIGHSYGSTTVADAFANSGMHANNAILLGSPGTDLARSAADFQLPEGGHVYVGAASSDPITWVPQLGSTAQNYLNDKLGDLVGASAGLGFDPAADSFGSIRFHAEVPGADGLNPADHSYYYTVGSESLRAMTDIVTGNPGRLFDDNLIAEGRHLPHLTTPNKVDIPGLGRVEIPHLDVPLPGLGGFDVEPEDSRAGTVTSNHQYGP